MAPFYLSATTRPSQTLSRDAPSVIRARIASVSLTCAVCSTITLLILTTGAGATYGEVVLSMGWWPVGLGETAKSLLLTATLFSGPLYETLIVHGGWRDWLRLQPVYELFSEWTTWRNIVAVSSFCLCLYPSPLPVTFWPLNTHISLSYKNTMLKF